MDISSGIGKCDSLTLAFKKLFLKIIHIHINSPFNNHFSYAEFQSHNFTSLSVILGHGTNTWNSLVIHVICTVIVFMFSVMVQIIYFNKK